MFTFAGQHCEVGRMDLELATTTICVPLEPEPVIAPDGFGGIGRIFWKDVREFDNATNMPWGVITIYVNARPFGLAPVSDLQTANLPGLKYVDRGRLSYFQTDVVEFMGQPFHLRCVPALSPTDRAIGSEYCEISGYISEQLTVRVTFNTIVWLDREAWPPLNSNWLETWPAYLRQLEEAIYEIIQIQ